jgi:ArsR family metal-binding transcriptional regulator
VEECDRFGVCRARLKTARGMSDRFSMTEYPRITYHAREGPSTVSSKVQNFTIYQTGFVLSPFILNEEQSLDETKNVVRKKLGLGHDDAVELAQLRDGKRIDLEDGGSIPQSFMRKLILL